MCVCVLGEGGGLPLGYLNSDLFTAVGGENQPCVSVCVGYTQTPISSSLLAVKAAFVCASPYPPRLSVITVSLRSRHPPGGLNLLINLVLIVCTKAPIMS